MKGSEQARIERLRAVLGTTTPGVTVGIGDDAAVLAPGARSLVWTIDQAVEGVHFRRDWLTWEDVGWKSFMAAASDLAAMGARPRGALAAIALPRDAGDDVLEGIARGQREAADALGTAVIGGNLSAASEVSIATTLVGEADRPLLRSGAAPGDWLVAAGPLGLARAGFEALSSGVATPEVAAVVSTWRRPVARIDAGLAAAAVAHAAIDVSDGLSLDLARLAAASGVAAMLVEPDLLAAAGPDLARAASALGRSPTDLAVEGGEDYAVVAAIPAGPLPPGFRRIGRCEAGSGVHLERADGTRHPLQPRGFDHFAPA